MPMLLLLVLFFATLTLAANGTDCAVNVPGFTPTNDCKLLCRNARWTDIIVFYLGNYIAHAGTISSRPGQSLLNTIVTVFSALLLPGAGVAKGTGAILSCAKFAPTPLRQAAKAGALCVVVKHNESSYGDAGNKQSKDAEANVESKGPGEARGSTPETLIEPCFLNATMVHGVWKLPKNYRLMVLPGKYAESAESADDEGEPKKECLVKRLFKASPKCTQIGCSYNLVQIAISIGQLLFAITTLYLTSDNQISQYGYAAFGLTVAPYAWMSLVNLTGNLLCPQYSSMFLVGSKTLDDVRVKVAGNESNFPLRGEVGRIPDAIDERVQEAYKKEQEWVKKFYGYLDKPWTGRWYRLVHGDEPFRVVVEAIADYFSNPLVALLEIGIAAIPVAIIGGLSGFSPGHSELYQRILTMCWIGFGATVGPFLLHVGEQCIEPRPILGGIEEDGRKGRINLYFYFLVIVGAGFYALPAIGGFVVTGIMIMQYGVCSEIPKPR